MFKIATVISAVTLLAGCAISPATAHFSKTGDFSSKERSVDCKYSVYTTVPKKSYEEVGVIAFIDVPHALPRTIEYVRQISNKEICKNGGNGLLLWEANGYGGYTKGTVIFVN